MDFKNKSVLITGGSRGIGKACAQAFAERGAWVAITYKTNEAAAKATVNQLPGERHIALQTNIEDAEAVRQSVNEVYKEFGQVDIVVNNAGIYIPHPVDIVSYADWQTAWQETMAVNLIGPSNVCYCAAQYMKISGGGKIINISSRGAFRGEPDQPAYGASKAGLNAMSQSLAQALAPYNILVGVVAPGFVKTDMTRDLLESPKGDSIRKQSPFGRVARPEEIAQAVLFLAADGSDFMSGGIIDVNGASYLRS